MAKKKELERLAVYVASLARDLGSVKELLASRDSENSEEFRAELSEYAATLLGSEISLEDAEVAEIAIPPKKYLLRDGYAKRFEFEAKKSYTEAQLRDLKRRELYSVAKLWGLKDFLEDVDYRSETNAQLISHLIALADSSKEFSVTKSVSKKKAGRKKKASKKK